MGGQGEPRENPSTVNYFQIPTNIYQEGDLLEEDLYFLYQGSYLLYRLKNLPWKADDKKRLDEFGVTHLFIRCENEREHNRFLENHLSRILTEPKISTKEKAKALYSTSLSIVEEVYERPHSSENLKRSMGSVRHSIDFLSRDKENFMELMSLAQASFSEYTHALHTTAYSITLAKQMGIRAFNQVSAIGIASILHDIGKVKIDQKLLSKEGVLTAAERVEVEKHPQYGFEIVHRTGSIPAISETMILQHHERLNGSGYPRGLSSEIHAYTKIISLCDCFDLLTSERSYKKALKPFEAIEVLRTDSKSEFDQNLIIEFIKMLKR